MLPPQAERKKLLTVLEQLSSAVEEQLLAGMTTATDATRQILSVALQEAARCRLLRLGSTLRSLGEELTRYSSQDTLFSRRRLMFFLNRAWLLSHGLAHALRQDDAAEYDRLNWSPTAQPLADVTAVCVGIVKRVSPGAFVAFDFRLRALSAAAPVSEGQRLTWSVVFPLKPGMEIVPEAFLHLPHKGKFAPFLLTERRSIRFERTELVVDEAGTGRLTVTDQTVVTTGEVFDDWERFLTWNPDASLERIRRHKSGPLDLDTELQEEVVLRDYEFGEQHDGDQPGQVIQPLIAGALQYSTLLGSGSEDKTLRQNLEDLKKLKRDRPPLYGMLHYEKCRLVLQPLAIFKPGPDYLTITKENLKKSSLLKGMSFN
jgi:hypothetical protein